MGEAKRRRAAEGYVHPFVRKIIAAEGVLSGSGRHVDLPHVFRVSEHAWAAMSIQRREEAVDVARKESGYFLVGRRLLEVGASGVLVAVVGGEAIVDRYERLTQLMGMRRERSDQ